MMIGRRRFLRMSGQSMLLAGAGIPALAENLAQLPFDNGGRALVQYPGKRPLLRMTTRPPQLETPFAVFDESLLTPADAFFVRYHLSEIPTQIDPDTFRLTIKGKVAQDLSLSLADLKAFEPQEIVAVNQCSGNSRGLFNPRVAGGQLANGAIGNARWRGVSLKAVLDKAGVAADAKQVTFNGMDGPASPATPDFVKALDIDHARDAEVMLAYQMNGEDLPFLNGYPIRLIVPGFYGTYWVKHLNEITVIDTVFDGFWMKSAYRIPANACACTEPGKAPASTVPITRFNVRSFITNLTDGSKVKAGPTMVRGIAFDGGYGITSVAISADGGKENWIEAALGEDLGKYSFRPWQITLSLPPGQHTLKVRAVNKIGQSQPTDPLWNPAGYMRNVVETVTVQAV